MLSTLAKRWLTGVILASAIFGIILYASSFSLTVLIMIAAVGGIWEYNNIVLGNGFLQEKVEGTFFAVLIPLVVFLGGNQYLLPVLAFCIILTFILFLSSVKDASFDVTTVAKVVLGIMYIPFLLSHFILLRELEKGISWILFVLVLAFAGDITALYVGKYLGKHKLSPIVSPAKTVEGTIGLILGSTVACLLYSYFVFPEISLEKTGILAFIGSIIGQLGDLSESAIKRYYGFKDASSLLPGHGGLLDRLDCILFIVPYVYYYRIYVID
jgi:phosphatidate cytidylyltransferase